MTPTVLGLGSNLGDGLALFERALGMLGDCGHVRVVAPVVTSAPMYVNEQPEFLNTIALFDSAVGPFRLLGRLKEIERALGRRSRERYGPREIDLDIISFGALILYDHELRVPHPRAFERRFVLEPLVAVDPDAQLPGFGLAADLLHASGVLDQRVGPLAGPAPRV